MPIPDVNFEIAGVPEFDTVAGFLVLAVLFAPDAIEQAMRSALTAIEVNARDSRARRALVLHDRPLVVDLIQLTLNHGLFIVTAATNLGEAEAALAKERPHLAVVDMDHDDSTALLARLGASNTVARSVTPVIGLTRRGDLKTKLRAFDLGVDDILTMPFSPEELLARAIVVSRRASGTDRPIVPVIKLGEMEIDIVNRVVRAGDSVVHLSGIEQSLLYLLASRGGRVVTREDILDAIWGTDFVAESNIVDRHIRSLRIKLQNDYRHPRFIATVSGQGYRFVPKFSNLGWNGGSLSAS
jgi:DNA-binding response OmpR family regulator